jgi:putative tryptophan/tyrosine transport system substrate-binding protein
MLEGPIVPALLKLAAPTLIVLVVQTLVGGAAAAWPLGGYAQEAMPVIGFMSSRSPEDSAHLLEAFRRGLREGGFTDGENVVIEFRWARGDYSRLPTLAADLVSRRVNVISASGVLPRPSRRSATIPIVSSLAADPISTAWSRVSTRPGGNVTGFAVETELMEPKRLGLLRELAPNNPLFGASSIRISLRWCANCSSSNRLRVRSISGSS